MSEASEVDAPEGVPWMTPEIQQRIKWRDGDIVISVPAKSGTTWTMNIVHQLIAGGSDDFADIYAEVPWIEFLTSPKQTHEDVLERVEAMLHDRRRAFKTHSAPPQLPYIPAESGTDVRYIVVFRNPEEALVSFRPFIDQHSDAWFDLWNMPKAAICRPDFASFYNEVIDPHGMQGMFFGFLAAWWPLRNESNVLFLHYSDMKKSHEASIRKVAAFLDIHPTDDQWRDILEFTSFQWMKKHEDKFELRSAGDVLPLNPGAMIRQGEIGKAKSDGMTEEISNHLAERGRQICGDANALKWFYEGGTGAFG